MIKSLLAILTLIFLLGILSTSNINAYTVYDPSQTGPYTSPTLPPAPPDYVFYCDADRELCPNSGPTGYYSTLNPGGSYTTSTNIQTCTDLGQPPNNVCCTTPGGCSFPNQPPVPEWAFEYAASCTISKTFSGQLQPTINYTYQQCQTTDTCYSGESYLHPGICNASQYNQSLGPQSACTIGGIYKTCCNSDGTVDGACTGSQYTGTCTSPITIVCGVSSCAGVAGNCTTQPCGTSACATIAAPTPTPTTQIHYSCSGTTCVQNTAGAFSESTCGGTCTSTNCPSYAPPPTTSSGSCPAGTTCIAQQPSQTVQAGCNQGTQCSPACAFTCRDSVGNTCPATTCSTVWQCINSGSGTAWYNGGQYYYSCPSSCPACVPGSTQTVCGTTQNACHIPGT